MLSKRLRASEEGRAHPALERRAIEAAVNPQFCALMNGAQSMKASLNAAHVGSSQGSQIENGAGAFRNHVGACAALDDVGVDAHVAACVVPLFDAGDLGS